MYAPATHWSKHTGFDKPPFPAVPADKSQPPLTLWTQNPATYKIDCCMARCLTDRDPHWDKHLAVQYQCGKPPVTASGLCARHESNKAGYDPAKGGHNSWNGLIHEAPLPDTAIFWLPPGSSVSQYRNHPTKKSMPKWCPDGYKPLVAAPVASLAPVPKAPVAPPKAPAPAPAAAEETGELKLIDGTLYMVKSCNVYEYDELEEKVGDFVGRLTAEETIDTEGEEIAIPEEEEEEPEPAKPASALSLLTAAVAKATQEAVELLALRATVSALTAANITLTAAAVATKSLKAENTSLKAETAAQKKTILHLEGVCAVNKASGADALRAENAALKAKLASVKALFTS